MSKFWQFKNLAENKAELYLYGEIVSETPWYSDDCVSYRDFINDLKALGDCENITVYINSGGGDVFAANAIYSQLKKHKADITVEIEGICASAATIIAMAGDMVKAEKNSLIMIHNPCIGIIGYFDETELDKYKNSLSVVKKSIIEAYLSKIDKTEDELSELMDKETWYTGKEAFEAGIIDEVFEVSENESYINDGKFLVMNNLVCDIGRFKNFPKEKIKNKSLIKSSKKKALTEPFFDVEKEDKEVISMTLQEVKDKYPEVYDEIRKEGAEKERERLKAIDEIAATLPSEMVEAAKYRDYISAEALAFKAVKENKAIGTAFFDNIVSDNEESKVKDVDSGDGLSKEKDKKTERINRLVGFMNRSDKGGIK